MNIKLLSLRIRKNSPEINSVNSLICDKALQRIQLTILSLKFSNSMLVNNDEFVYPNQFYLKVE